jgi:hypothetical protein
VQGLSAVPYARGILVILRQRGFEQVGKGRESGNGLTHTNLHDVVLKHLVAVFSLPHLSIIFFF